MSLTGSWRRTNIAGREVSLLAGPVVALGAGAVVRTRGSMPLAVAVALVGRYDDLVDRHPAPGRPMGLLGHGQALLAGRLTGGAVKALAVPAVAALLVPTPGPVGRAAAQRAATRLLDTVTVAVTADAVNRLDVVPGRALKAVLATVAVLLAAPTRPGGRRDLAALAVVVAGALPLDLGERAMLGDCGANALGAVLGLVVVGTAPPAARAGLLGGALVLVAVAERTSISAVVDRHRLLTRADGWGRRRPA